MPKILRTYFGSPTGICVYEGTLLPKKYWGQPLHTDAGPRQVRCYHLTPDGAGYDVDREDMVTSTDNWFRPSDICVGAGRQRLHRRLVRSRRRRPRHRRLHARPHLSAGAEGNKPSAPKVDLESKEGSTAALASPNLAVRYMAMAKLGEHGPAAGAWPCWKPAAMQKENAVAARPGAVAARPAAADAAKSTPTPSRTQTRVSASWPFASTRNSTVSRPPITATNGTTTVRKDPSAMVRSGPCCCCAMRTRPRRSR